MNIDKGNKVLNCIFGTFILLSSIKISADLYSRYKEQRKPCGCKKQ